METLAFASDVEPLAFDIFNSASFVTDSIVKSISLAATLSASARSPAVTVLETLFPKDASTAVKGELETLSLLKKSALDASFARTLVPADAVAIISGKSSSFASFVEASTTSDGVEYDSTTASPNASTV